MSKLITTKVTRELLGNISTMSEWRRRTDGTLPPMVKITGRNYDLLHEIEAIIAAHANGATPPELRALVADLVAKRKLPSPASMCAAAATLDPLPAPRRKVGA